LDLGVINPNTRFHPIFQPSEFVGGPAATTAFPGHADFFEQLGSVANTGVDIITERQVFHPAENYEPPTCPVCESPIDEEAHHDLIDDWLSGPEPMLKCPTCRSSALVGDWRGEWTFHVGELAVTFNNWPPLSDEFMENLGRRLGTRWRVVLAHI
jgi:hypothetical protein